MKCKKDSGKKENEIRTTEESKKLKTPVSRVGESGKGGPQKKKEPSEKARKGEDLLGRPQKKGEFERKRREMLLKKGGKRQNKF